VFPQQRGKAFQPCRSLAFIAGFAAIWH
jgi:hypothetical protein